MKTPYAAFFDEFVRSRGIDEDDTYWSEDDWVAWGQALKDYSSDPIRFQGGRPVAP